MAKRVNKTAFDLQDEEKLIEFVKSNELIYNVQHPMYRNSSMKQRLWNEFASSIEKDGEFIIIHTLDIYLLCDIRLRISILESENIIGVILRTPRISSFA